jgi:8-amino-3,8-dideoxy-alpha-D-manno-octulosonate transaminase
MINRRSFLLSSALAGAAATTATGQTQPGKSATRVRPSADYYGPQFYGQEERSQLMEVLDTRCPFRWYGPDNRQPAKVSTFEKEFAEAMESKYCLAVTSGTAALQTALAALEIGPGDEVILPAWTWHSCYSAIVLAGALPVFAEIDESFNIDPGDIESRITPQTKVIMAVHLQGNPADMDAIQALARKHNLRVLEDCAQSVGGSYHGKPLGSIGDISIYSLQLNKTITAGEGGAVVTNDPLLFERAGRFHDVGSFRAPHEAVAGKAQLQPFVGCNFRMSEFTGGVLLAQTRKLAGIVKNTRAAAAHIYQGLADLPGIQFRRRPDPAGEIGVGVFVRFKAREQRDRYVAALRSQGVAAGPPSGSVILPIQEYIEQKRTVHPGWPSFTSERGRSIRYGAACCPRTIQILEQYAGVAVGPKFTEQDAADIVRAVRKVYPTGRLTDFPDSDAPRTGRHFGPSTACRPGAS